MTNNLAKNLDIAKSVAYEIGKLQIKFYNKKLKIIRKAKKELVSNVDMECQKLSYDLFKKKSIYPVLSEEERNIGDYSKGCCWIVDPLDGSHNFIAGLPIFGVSIALVCDQKPLIGVIYLPFFDQLYYASKGFGGYMNGQKIHVSENNTLEKSMVTYDNKFDNSLEIVNKLYNLSNNIFTMRILGSAVFDFGLISIGKIDARIWNNTKIFDIAAGAIIVKECGGKVTDFHGNDITMESNEIVASNGLIHKEIIKIINKKEDL